MAVIRFENLACTGNARIITAGFGQDARIIKVVSMPKEPDPTFTEDETLEHCFVLYQGQVYNSDGSGLSYEEIKRMGIDVTVEIMSMPWEMLG